MTVQFIHLTEKNKALSEEIITARASSEEHMVELEIELMVLN